MDSDVAKLVYRDNVQVKHCSKKRLSQEVQSLTDSAGPVALYERNAANPKEKLNMLGGPLSKALTAYLLEVSKRDVTLIFSLKKTLLGKHLRNVELSYPSQTHRSSDESACIVTCYRPVLTLCLPY